MDVVTGVELEYSYGAGDGRTRSGVVSMPKERSGGPRLDWSCDWEKYGYDNFPVNPASLQVLHILLYPIPCIIFTRPGLFYLDLTLFSSDLT